jgi:multiple sugar transport system substrate-binding protein
MNRFTIPCDDDVHNRKVDKVVTKRQTIVRVAGIAAAGVLTTAGLAACSGSGSGSDTGDKNITIGMNSGLVKQFQGYAEAFEKEHKGYKVTVKAVPDAQADYIQQLTTQGLSKSLPDIVFNYDTLNQTLVSNHLLYDIKPWLDEGKDGLKGSSFQKNFLDQYVVGDQITGIPVSADTGIIVYNKTLFAKYGVAEPKSGWTYDEFYADAKTITQKSGGDVYGFTTPIGDGSALFTYYPVLVAEGSNLYDPDSKKFVFANDGGIAAWTKLLQPYTDKFGTPFSLATKSANFLQSGQVAMTIASTAGVANFRATMKDDWNIVTMPVDNGEQTTGGGSYSLSITNNADNKEGAWTFLSWFYSNDGGMKLGAKDGIVPATSDGIENGAWKENAATPPADFVDTVTNSVSKAILPNAIPDDVQPKVVPAIQQAMQEVLLQGKSVKDAFTDAQTQLNALLK